MRFKVDEITSVIKQEIEQYRSEIDVSEVGRVLEVGDGIAQIYGLSNAMSSEMLTFANGAAGQIFNLEENSIGAVIFGDYLGIKEGDEVRRTGELLSVPVGEALLGRVVDPIGNPLDGKGIVESPHRMPLEIKAPGVAVRQPVNVPLQTGIKAIDSMIPIGRGQRELIIGDRKTGKTAIAIDAIINQRQTGVICVYVAIGQKESTVAAVIDTLNKHHAMSYTIVVAAGASAPAPLQYIAPYAGCAMAEYFCHHQGRDTLVIYDDLTKQAQSYRQLSLLLRRPPGREAYPGDIFYLHSRLLERACKTAEHRIICRKDAPSDTAEGANKQRYIGVPGLRQAKKDLETWTDKDQMEIRKIPGTGGSLTALPIIETQEGEVSAYIPTNVISITDGQIYLEPDLFFAGVRPAVNVGISVSRVGGNAQIKAMKRVAGSLRLDLAAYRELEAFAQLGTELDVATQKQLDRGRLMVELLKQPQYNPCDVIDQVLAIYAASHGFMDHIPSNKIAAYEKELIKHFQNEFPEIREQMRKQGDFSNDLTAKVKDVLSKFKPKLD